MKKWIALLMAVVLLCSVAGCGSSIKEPVSFYYLRGNDHIVYGAEDGLVASEIREASGHVDDLEYLITLYLAGPLDSELVSPFPEGVRLQNLVRHRNSLVIVLNENFSQLSGVELTTACACLSATCFALTDAESVTITSPETELEEGIGMTLTRQSIALIDEVFPAPETE